MPQRVACVKRWGIDTATPCASTLACGRLPWRHRRVKSRERAKGHSRRAHDAGVALSRLQVFFSQRAAEEPYNSGWQTDTAEAIGVSQSTISRWAKGLMAPDLLAFEALVRFTRLDPSFFFDESLGAAPRYVDHVRSDSGTSRHERAMLKKRVADALGDDAAPQPSPPGAIGRRAIAHPIEGCDEI